MSAAEFGMHYDDYLRNPWGPALLKIVGAQIVQAVANYAGKVRKEPVKLTDCMLVFAPSEEEREPEPEVDPAAFFGQFNFDK